MQKKQNRKKHRHAIETDSIGMQKQKKENKSSTNLLMDAASFMWQGLSSCQSSVLLTALCLCNIDMQFYCWGPKGALERGNVFQEPLSS